MEKKFGELQPLSEPERTSGVSKIIGDDPEKFTYALRKIFELGGEVEIGEIEREKSAEETEIIEGILEKMPDFIKRYGGDSVPLSVGHVHFLDKEKVSPEILKMLKHQGEEGFYNSTHQLLGVYDAKNLLLNALVVVHEALHFNSFQSIELEGEEKAHNRRGGFEIYSRKNRKIYFNEINEAVIEELVKRFNKESFADIGPLQEELREREWVANKHGRILDGANVPDDDIAAVTEKGWPAGIVGFAYPAERQNLNKLIDDIFENNQQDFDSREDVFNLFAEAVIAGKLLSIAKFVEKTYGKGSFRQLGEETKKK